MWGYLYQRTPLHWVCRFNNPAVLKVIMRLVTSEQTQYKLLQELDSAGHTPLHLAAHRNTTQAIRIIADSVSSHHLIHLLTITDHGLGYTSVQFAAAWRDNQEAEKNCYKLITLQLIS